MMAHFGGKYQPGTKLRESSCLPPTEEEMQALWFEQWYAPRLHTDDGTEIEIVQAGNWNHTGGPDFLQAAVRHADGRVAIGSVELHRRALDWDGHGHHVDPAYDETVLHVVWEPPAKKYYPATNSFRCVPQVVIKDQLAAPWEMLRPHIAPLLAKTGPLPSAKAGRCQKRLAFGPPEQALELLRAAGAFRLRQKAQRLGWKMEAVGLRQALWEALAEGLGYSQNKIPFRLLAQRLPHGKLMRFPREKRAALIFGLSGLLPATNLTGFDEGVKRWIQPQWELWWKERTRYDYAILPRRHWKLNGLRPWNRPERRLAALLALAPLLADLQLAIARVNVAEFTRLLQGVKDPFWDRHTTFTAAALTKPHHLIGTERINDLLANVFWPAVSNRNPVAAETGWREMESAPNKITELARQRVIGSIDLRGHWQETLVQQGLIQVYNDYCLTDYSGCADCELPQLIDRT